MFDPYRRWLSIPEDRRPPTHYQLLGVAADETDSEVIEAAVLRQSAYVRNFQVGKYADDAARILNEIAVAKICLLNPAARSAYDAELRKQGRLEPPPHETPVAPLAPQPHLTPAPARVARPQAGPPQAARPPRAAPAIDLDALAGQAGLSGRGTRQPRVRLTTRSKQNTIPPHYWLIPVAAAGVMLVVVLVLAVGKRTGSDAPPRDRPEAGPLDGQTVEESTAAFPIDDARTTPNTSSPDQRSANSGQPLENAPRGKRQDGLSPIASALPAAQTKNLPGSDLPDGDLPESEKNSGSPAEFPGETDGGESKFAIPLPPRDPFLVFAQGMGHFVAAGQTVYDSRTGELSGKTGAFQARSRDALRALSSDGKLYASASETGSSGIEVRSCESGEWRSTLHLNKSVLALKLLEFGGPDRLISSARFDDAQRVQVWELAGGERIKEFQTVNFNRSQAALNQNGAILAVAAEREIVMYDVRRSVDKRPGEVLARMPLAPADEDVVNVDGLSFSPDGGELAAVVDGGARILDWNERGELLFEYDSKVDLRALWTGACVYQGPAIEWRPGGGGWLLNGHFFFDRNLRRVIWMLQTDRDEEARMKFLDEERLLLLRGGGAERRLADIAIPWNKIGQALAAVQADAPRYLGPGGAIGLEVNIGQLLEGAAKDDVRRELEKMVAARFQAEGIRVAEGQPTLLRLFYSERAARLPGAAGGELLNQCDLKLRLSIADGARHMWAANVVAESKAAGSAARMELYDRLGSRLHQTPVPYFIPKSAQLTSLPAIIRP